MPLNSNLYHFIHFGGIGFFGAVFNVGNLYLKHSFAKRNLNNIGFGTFEAKEQAAREGRNPATGEKIEIAACKRPAFSASQASNFALSTV